MIRLTVGSKEKKLENVLPNTAVFARKGGKLVGMLVNEEGGNGWILKIGGSLGADGHHSSRQACAGSALQFGYEFFIEDED